MEKVMNMILTVEQELDLDDQFPVSVAAPENFDWGGGGGGLGVGMEGLGPESIAAKYWGGGLANYWGVKLPPKSPLGAATALFHYKVKRSGVLHNTESWCSNQVNSTLTIIESLLNVFIFVNNDLKITGHYDL